MHESLQPYLDRVEIGHIRMVKWDGLVLFNYTDKCTFDKAWDEYTTKARGIIFNEETGEIVARPFDKFFNYGEHEGIYGRDQVQSLLKSPHYLQQKLDGSLGIIYWWKDSWRVATRGSFSSDQAIRGQIILNKYQMAPIGADLTFLVEIIYPENKIIVPYGDREELMLLAVRCNITGTYVSMDTLQYGAPKIGMPLAGPNFLTVQEALAKQKTIPYTEEGWVVVFACGTRLKIKGDDYMRIAKFKSGLSPIAVWEALSLGRLREFEVACPEECRAEMELIERHLFSDCTTLRVLILNEGSTIDWKGSRKEVAMAIQQKPKWMQGALFLQLSGAPIDGFIWKLLRPDGNCFASLDFIKASPE